MNEYDDLIAQNQQAETAKSARLGFSVASETDPDSYAEAQRVARRTGVPVDTVLNMPKEMKQQDRMAALDFDAMAKTTPATAAIMADVERAKIAHDDVENLAGIESVFQFAKNSGNALYSGLPRMSEGIVGIAQAPFDLAAPLLDPLAGRLLPENPLRRVSAGLAGYRRGLSAAADSYMPRGDGNIEQGWYSGLASLSRNLTTLPLAFLPGGQPAALAGMTAPVFGEEFGKARDKGLGPVNAATYGASQAAIEYATEKIPLSKLVGDVKSGEAFFKMLGRQAAAEVPGEQVATILQDLNEWAVLNPEKPFSAYLAERPDAAAQTLVATLVGVGGQTTVVKGIDSAIALVEGRKQRAEMSDRGTKFLEGLNKLAAADKLLARDPETFEAFVAQAAEGGPVQQVFIDAKTLMQSGVAEQVAAVSPAVAAQLEAAVATGGQIAIPVEEYTARIAPTEYAQGLLDHLKTEADGFSRAEAQEYMQSGAAQELEAEAQRILGEKEGDDTFKASAEVVRNEIRTQLDTAARFTPQVNDAYSAMVGNFYATMAAKMGTTPEELFRRYPLKIAAERIDGPQFDQEAVQTDTPEFRNWFGDSKVVNADGKPLVVYHGTLSDFSEFQNHKGVYFTTPDPDFAARFTTEESGDYAEGAQILPVYVTATNPFDYENKKHVDAVAIRAGLTRSAVNDIKKGKWQRLEDRTVLEAIKDAGFDGVYVNEDGVKNLAVFSPEQIKSATGNQGTFDPNDPNILHQFAGQQFDQGGTLDDLRQQLDSSGIKNAISEKGGVITLSQVVVPEGERGGGKGTAAMQALIDYADRTGQHIALSPSADFGGNKKRLVEFYKRFGFVENKGKNRAFTTSESMYRQAEGKVLYQNGEQLGPFGPVLTDFKGDTQGAIAKLMEMKSGEAIGALNHPDIGDIDLVWGEEGTGHSDGYGLAKIAKYHPEVLGDLQGVISAMKVTTRSENRINLESEDHRAGVRLTWDNQAKHWLVTAFEKKEGGVTSTTSDTAGLDGEGDTARLSDASDDIVDQKINEFYQFAGQRAQGADLHALDTAKQRIAAGENAETVRRDTGWFKGNDGKWRYEISDADAKFIGKDSMEQAAEADPYKVAEMPLGDVLDHPALFAAYPKLRSVMVAYEATSAAAGDLYFGASYNSADNTISLGNGLTNEQMASALLHEIQHGIQTIEGFATGGSLEIAGIVKAQAKREWDHWSNAYTIKREMEEAGHSLDEAVAALNDLDFGINADQIADAQRYTLAELKAKNDAAYAELQRTGDGPRSTYLKIAGEVEARNTQARADLTDEQRRATPPGATADTADQDVILVFNGKEMAHAPAIANAFEQTARGAFNPASLSITLLKGADLSTFLHESGHFFLEVQADLASKLQQEAEIFGMDTLKPGERQILADTDALLKWFGLKDLNEWNGLDFEQKRSYHEQFARGFEVYLFEGKAPSIELQGLFQRFRAWMVSIYRELKNLNVELTDEVRGVMDRMLATNEQIMLAEQGRSMMPLFTSPEQAGMTVEEFAAYQALGVDATNDAIQDLQARGLRDMQWLHNARGRVIKRLQREANDQRAAVEMDVRREVMSQPIYRAWTFLTAKQTREDMLDSEKARADYRESMTAWNAARKSAETEARKDAKQAVWAASEEGQKKYRKDGALVKAQQKVLKREDKAIEADVQKALAEWEVKNRKPVDPDVAPKSSPDVLDETRDSLFVAIAKLGGINKAETVGTWGVDPADKPQSGVFGKPVWRIDGGLSIDGMAEALSQYGYLALDENGKWDIRELEDRFKAELGGDAQLSTAYGYSADQQQGDAITNPAGLTAGRIDLPALSDMGLPVEVVNAIKARKMTAKAGLHPDQVADIIIDADGNPVFSSGDELVRALAAADTPKDAINALTDIRMLEQFGDLSSPEAIEKAADKAIHNEARARMIATEANALAKAAGQRKVMADAAREFARAMVARVKVRNIKPGQYANAQVRAGKASEKASRDGDLATAAAEKRNQLIQTYATRAAHEAQDDVDAGLRYLKRFDGKVKGLDADYIDQIDALLERFDLRKGQSLKAIDKRKSFAAWLTAQREAGLEPDIPESLENDAYRISYKDMSVEEFRGLLDTIKQIEHLGRVKNKLLTARDERELAAIVAEAEASIRENGGKERPVELETPRGFKPWLEGIAAGHRKLASLLRQMDGGKDNGPMWRALGRGMNDAGTAEAVMIEDATKRLAEIFKPILAMKGGTTGDKRSIPAINGSLTRGGRLAVALNWGNKTNRQRVMDGDRWSPAQVNAILSTLTREEWTFVQNAWDFIDSYWPDIAAKEKRVTGRAPDKVQAAPFSVTLADGTVVNLRGGYYPIKYDSNRDDKAEKHDAAAAASDMMRGAFTRSTTRRGHTKERVENVKRPVKKTLDVITQHVSEVAHDLAWHEWLIDANRLIDEPKINQAIRDHYGTEVIRTIKDTLQSIATADIIPQSAGDKLLLYFKANVSRATMGLSLTTAFLQPFGLTQSMVRIGPKYVLRGLARWIGDASRFQNAMTWIGDKSDFMRLRNKTFNRELHEIKGRVVQGRSQARQIYDASLFMLMQKMQMVADVPTWIGAYEKALAENHDDATAVAMADQAVLDSQGGGQTKDMSELQRKHPMLSMFYSYFSVTLNLAAESTAKTDFKNPLAVAGWLSDMALLMVIPALGPALILHLLKGGGEDDDLETWLKRLAGWQAGYLMGTAMFLREGSGLVSGFDYTGPPAGRIITELERLSKQAQQGELDEGLAMSAVQVMGAAVGIPSVQIVRSWRGWNAWAEDDAPATSILLGPPPKD